MANLTGALGASGLQRVGLSLGGASPGAGRFDDLHEGWKSIFEQARPVDHRTGEAMPRVVPERPSRSGPLHGVPEWSGASAGTSDPGPIRPPAVSTVSHVPAALVGQGRSAGESEALIYAASSRATHGGGPARPPAAECVASQSTQRTTAWQPLVRSPAHAAEAVTVRVIAGAVTVVVRNAGLSAREAVASGFEVAQRLTGQRASLLRLTLNGQAVYEQPAASADLPDVRTAPVIVFEC